MEAFNEKELLNLLALNEAYNRLYQTNDFRLVLDQFLNRDTLQIADQLHNREAVNEYADSLICKNKFKDFLFWLEGLADQVKDELEARKINEDNI